MHNGHFQVHSGVHGTNEGLTLRLHSSFLSGCHVRMCCLRRFTQSTRCSVQYPHSGQVQEEAILAASLSCWSILLLDVSSLSEQASSKDASDKGVGTSLVAGKQLLANVEQLDCGSQLFKLFPAAGARLFAELEGGSQLFKLLQRTLATVLLDDCLLEALAELDGSQLRRLLPLPR